MGDYCCKRRESKSSVDPMQVSNFDNDLHSVKVRTSTAREVSVKKIFNKAKKLSSGQISQVLLLFDEHSVFDMAKFFIPRWDGNDQKKILTRLPRVYRKSIGRYIRAHLNGEALNDENTETELVTGHHPDSPNSLDPDSSEMECIICIDRRKNILLIPCMHVCYCKECSGVVELHSICPICRGVVTNMVQIYL